MSFLSETTTKWFSYKYGIAESAVLQNPEDYLVLKMTLFADPLVEVHTRDVYKLEAYFRDVGGFFIGL